MNLLKYVLFCALLINNGCVNNSIEQRPLTKVFFIGTAKFSQSNKKDLLCDNISDINDVADQYLISSRILVSPFHLCGSSMGLRLYPVKSNNEWICRWEYLNYGEIPIYGSYLEIRMTSQLALLSITRYPDETPELSASLLRPKLTADEINQIFQQLNLMHAEIGMTKLFYVYYCGNWKLAYLVHLGQRHHPGHQHCWLDANTGELLELDDIAND